MSYIYPINLFAVGIFGMILSIAFCDIQWTRTKALIMAGSMAVIFLFQGIVYFGIDSNIVKYIYPFMTHFPLIAVLCLLSKKCFWPSISVLTAYLCCQTRRWLALMIVAIFDGDSVMQDMAELALTLPILLILLRVAAPSVRFFSQCTKSVQLQFGLVPALYYGFDYLTRIYTNLLLQGTLAAVEFMPFMCSVAYIIFVVYASKEGRIRSHLEQTQEILNLQVAQAVREIATLQESQQKIKVYRHDLRHHIQYLSSCIENNQLERAQGYIREIYSEIESNQVISFCTNEAANLILSVFVERAQNADIPIKIETEISQNVQISESDLCVLLSNALENALHACLRCKEKGMQASIEVTAHEKNGKFFLQFVNSCDGDVRFYHGIPVTSRSGHGIGVRSICAIVEQYNGIYDFSLKDDKFILRVSWGGWTIQCNPGSIHDKAFFFRKGCDTLHRQQCQTVKIYVICVD